MNNSRSLWKKYLTVLGATILIFIVVAVGVLCGAYWYFNFSRTPFGAHSGDVEISEGTLDEIVMSRQNILVLGTDVSGRLTDVIMLCQIDPDRKCINVLSIPRDTRVTVNGKTQKINAAYSIGGVDRSINIVKEITGIPINHYVVFSTRAFRDCIDALDGVDFDVPSNMNYDDPYQNLHIHLTKGFQHLDGDKAEQLVRFRSYREGDLHRISVQQDLLHALVEQKVNLLYFSKIDDIYNILYENVLSDLTLSDIRTISFKGLSLTGNVNTYLAKTTYADPYVVIDQSYMATMRDDVFDADGDGNPVPGSEEEEVTE